MLARNNESAVISHPLMPQETIYGTTKRMEWVKKFINKDQKVIDVGCGTGSMMTIPLYLQGYNISGYDLDVNSIEYGKALLSNHNIKNNFLFCQNIKTINHPVDVIILSQILEHLNTTDLYALLDDCFGLLKPGGLLLITVPNGYGFFELESFFWFKLRIGKLLEFLKIVSIITRIKKLFINQKEPFYSSLDSSPHVQRFTYFSLAKILRQRNYSIKNKTGGSFICGPFSNLLFTGIKPIIMVNNLLGKIFPAIASDFYILAQKQSN